MSSSYEIVYMRADFEPWWQFDGWEEHIVERWIFNNKEAFEQALQLHLSKMRDKFPNERQKNGVYYAFWDEEELEYCEGCDEDAQVFHGIIAIIPS